MAINITELNHVNVTVPRSVEEEAKRFYGTTLGLREIPKPGASRDRGGAWYQLGTAQLHLSLEEGTDALASRRHVCVLVLDLEEARHHFVAAGTEIFPDDKPIAGWSRFYVRDPGGNRIEVAQAK